MARVKKIMLTDAPTLKKEAKIKEAAKSLAHSESGCVVIVEDKKAVGIVTETDLVKCLVSKESSLKEPVSKIMTSPVTFMTPSMKLDEALKIIDTKKFKKYPVIENDKLVGIAYKKDVVQAVSDNVKMHRNIQNLILVLFVLFEFFFMFYEYLFPIFAFFGV